MNFSFIQITDHHLREAEHLLTNGYASAYALRKVMRHIAQNVAHRADFIVTTGDIVETGADLDLAYQNVQQMLNAQSTSTTPAGQQLISTEGLYDFPMYFLPGNLDDRDAFFRHLLPNIQPMALMNFAFPHKGIQFICIDWGPQDKAIGHPETYDFLVRTLQHDLPSVIFMHHHITPIGSRWMDNYIADNVSQFWSIVAKQNVVGIFCGHTHRTFETHVQAIPVFGLRSTAAQFVLQDEPLLCLQPPHYRFVTVQDGLVTTKIFEVPL